MKFERVDIGRNHKYKIDGKDIPGVTTLISNGIPKPAIARWAARSVGEYVADNLTEITDRQLGRDSLVGMLAGIPWGDRDAAANQGTQIHALAHALLDEQEVDVPEHLVGHVDSYLRFVADWEPHDEIAERPVVSVQWRYGGTFDLHCNLKLRRNCLIDLKTARSGIWPETALQLAAYRHADFYLDDTGELQPMPPIDHTLALWVRADGYDLYPVRTDESVFRSFLYAMDIAQRFAGKSREDFIESPLHPLRVVAEA